jgi:hypothetical protein
MGKRGENLRSNSIDNKKLDITPPYCYINIKIKKNNPNKKDYEDTEKFIE